MSGYSGTPLVTKLGIKDAHTVLLDGLPEGVDLGDLGAAHVVRRLPSGASLDVTLTFHLERSRFERRLPMLIGRTVGNGMIWVCWPKRASKVPTDLTEDVVREVALADGVVDVKVAAIDEVWSGLKLVRRLADR
ncbi:MAG: DUF3052 domain-containing protein [Nocardioides sp.]